jgi:hypothetical protein
MHKDLPHAVGPRGHQALVNKIDASSTDRGPRAVRMYLYKVKTRAEELFVLMWILSEAIAKVKWVVHALPDIKNAKTNLGPAWRSTRCKTRGVIVLARPWPASSIARRTPSRSSSVRGLRAMRNNRRLRGCVQHHRGDRPETCLTGWPPTSSGRQGAGLDSINGFHDAAKFIPASSPHGSCRRARRLWAAFFNSTRLHSWAPPWRRTSASGSSNRDITLRDPAVRLMAAIA